MQTLIDFQQNGISLLYMVSVQLLNNGLEGEAMQYMDLPAQKAYGCLYVKCGDEEKVAGMITKFFPSIEAHAIAQLKHRSRNGIHSYSSGILLPGYVIFCTSPDMMVSRLVTIDSVFRILTYGDNQWHLQGDDLLFAQWIFEHQGTIGVSVVYMEGDIIQIVEGPLITIEGEIVRIDKRNRNALVSLGFNKQAFKAWLAFEWMEKVSKN